MRPTRLLLTVCFLFFTLFLTFYTLLLARTPQRGVSSSSNNERGFHSLFSWRMPSALFPQSAIISLTDDNSTFFLSRPANYGPRLPTEGLSGQLWIGSGFSDDSILRGGANSQAEGELGCGDIPGWDAGQVSGSTSQMDDSRTKGSESDTEDLSSIQQGSPRRGQVAPNAQNPTDNKAGSRPKEDDGTDDHLHWPLKSTVIFPSRRTGKPDRSARTEHADIQSLQESAEIAGKVVLLSRGGCGFLEKTKWVQRRGGLALIVGDNIRGGPLTTMYGGGDASNISIPSIFTTRTTAHLLSSLIPPKSSEGSEDAAKGDENTAKLSPVVKESSKNKPAIDKAESPAPNSTPNQDPRPVSSKSKIYKRSSPAPESGKQDPGWFSSLLSGLGGKNGKAAGLNSDSSRPPSSGQINWVVSQEWDDDVGIGSANRVQKNSKPKHKGVGKSRKTPANDDSFVIGVQDWRDPDMMKPNNPKVAKTQSLPQDLKGSSDSGANGNKDEKMLSGGSHMPGSGVYHQTNDNSGVSMGQGQSKPGVAGKQAESNASKNGWLSHFFHGSPANGVDGTTDTNGRKAKAAYEKTVASHYVKEKEFEEFAKKRPIEHEGLWVTMTPTTISTTPFFDTILVLVVSPLVTLSVVYALLILRSRIRRRRWRAPKSVVERLPVRTYHTMAYSSTSTSSQTTSPEASSPASPLLRNSSKKILDRTRPRSRTTSVLAEEVSSSLDKATVKASLTKGDCKRLHPKKYNGRQIECVVCLEEYIDGHSRVMSLPCGHEFHAECITPWLTTRRRTCPICKGDVVRSMTTTSSSSSSTDVSGRAFRELPDPDDVQSEAVHTRNESPSAAIPIPQHGDSSDLERGEDLAATLVNDQQAASSTWNWRELAARSLSAVRGESWRQIQEDRSR